MLHHDIYQGLYVLLTKSIPYCFHSIFIDFLKKSMESGEEKEKNISIKGYSFGEAIYCNIPGGIK